MFGDVEVTEGAEGAEASGEEAGAEGEVPLGCVCRDAETGEVLGEVTEEGQELIIAKGGKTEDASAIVAGRNLL